MVPKGIILDCLCVLLGTNLGSAIKNHIPARINQPMNVIFGLSAIAIGITSVVKLHSLPAVILTFILGGLIGEAVNLDDKIKSLFQRILERLRFQIHGDKEVYMRFYLIVTVTFCASGTGADLAKFLVVWAVDWVRAAFYRTGGNIVSYPSERNTKGDTVLHSVSLLYPQLIQFYCQSPRRKAWIM